MQYTLKYILMCLTALSLFAADAAAQRRTPQRTNQRTNIDAGETAEVPIEIPVDKMVEKSTAPAEQLLGLLNQATDIARTLADEPLSDKTEPVAPVPVRNPFADAAVARLNESAVNLYKKLGSQKLEGDNTIFSPLSLTQAFRIVYAGAKNETAKQLRDTLALDLFPLEFNGSSAELQSANAVWVLGQDVPLTEEFKTQTAVLKDNFQIFPSEIDQSEALLQINKWFKEKTQGRIEKLFDQLDKNTKLVIGNAVFFKGVWGKPFDKKLTAEVPFYGLGGQQTAPMMNASIQLGYYKGADFAAVKIPYQKNRYAMTVILPDKDVDFKKFQAESLPNVFRNCSSNRFDDQTIQLSLPKWEMESSFDLIPALKALGITESFSNKADFSGITGDQSLNIGQVMQKANITVDEEGTVAAAATGIGMKLMAAVPQKPIVFKADRPFVYTITDEQTGLILFIGDVKQFDKQAADQSPKDGSIGRDDQDNFYMWGDNKWEIVDLFIEDWNAFLRETVLFRVDAKDLTNGTLGQYPKASQNVNADQNVNRAPDEGRGITTINVKTELNNVKWALQPFLH